MRLLIYFIIFSLYLGAFQSKGQDIKCELHFRDGEIKEGFIKDFKAKDQEIKFSSDLKGSKQKINSDQLLKIILINKDESPFELHRLKSYTVRSNPDKIKILDPAWIPCIRKGYVNLYLGGYQYLKKKDELYIEYTMYLPILAYREGDEAASIVGYQDGVIVDNPKYLSKTAAPKFFNTPDFLKKRILQNKYASNQLMEIVEIYENYIEKK